MEYTIEPTGFKSDKPDEVDFAQIIEWIQIAEAKALEDSKISESKTVYYYDDYERFCANYTGPGY